MVVLITARALTGVGGGGLMTMGEAIKDEYHLRYALHVLMFT